MEGKLAHNAPRVNWLQDEEFLQSNFPRARIMIFCYDAGWFYGAPVATLEQRARKLLRDLQRERLGGAVGLRTTQGVRNVDHQAVF